MKRFIANKIASLDHWEILDTTEEFPSGELEERGYDNNYYVYYDPHGQQHREVKIDIDNVEFTTELDSTNINVHKTF